FTHDQIRLFAAAIAKAVADKRPDIATFERLIRNRTGKVYIDYTQNGRGRTLASVYSPRAGRGAPVSTPVRWDELESDLDPRSVHDGCGSKASEEVRRSVRVGALGRAGHQTVRGCAQWNGD